LGRMGCMCKTVHDEYEQLYKELEKLTLLVDDLSKAVLPYEKEWMAANNTSDHPSLTQLIGWWRGRALEAEEELRRFIMCDPTGV